MHRLPPLKCLDPGEAKITDEVFYAVGDDGHWRGQTAPVHLARDGAQGGTIQVVHVCVSQKHSIDCREICNVDARTPLTPQEDETGGKDWIDEESMAGRLDEKRRVPDEGDSSFIRPDGGRFRWAAGERLRVAFPHKTPELTEFSHPEGKPRRHIDLLTNGCCRERKGAGFQLSSGI